MKKMEACPFCGSQNTVVQLLHPPFMLKRFHNRFIAAGCKDCGASTTLFYVHNKTKSPLLNEDAEKRIKEKAVAAWNRRTT